MDFEKLKSFFLKSLIGCLIAAAGLAVVSVLAGHFDDTLSRALFTILLVAIHCLVSFGFIVNNEKQKTFDNLTFFTNVTFVIIVLSFITSILGVWEVVPGDLVLKLYGLYFVLLFAVLHGETLAKTLGKQTNINNTVFVNYLFMVVVVLMLQPIIFAPNTSMGSIYYRILAAAGIIDATLTLTAVILDKMYIQKHPRIKDPVFNLVAPGQPVAGQPSAAVQPVHQTNIFVKILIVYVVLQLVGGVVLIAALAFTQIH